MGDKKPSQLLKQMKDLAGTSIADDAIKSLWLERLPESVRAVVSIAEGDSTQWAKEADKMMEISTFSTVASVYPFQDEIVALRKQINYLKTDRQSRGNDKSSSDNQRERSRSTKREYPFCRYHFKLSAKARKCTQPCQFKDNTKSEN